MIKKVKNDAHEEFIVTGHVILACAMELLGMSSVDVIPSPNIIQPPEDEGKLREEVNFYC